jgi:hypothetical protein
MADDPGAIREIPPLPLEPWIRLAQAVRGAMDAKKLILAALGLVLWHAGWAVLSHLLPGADPAGTSPPAVVVPPSPLEDPSGRPGALETAAAMLADPARRTAAPFVALFALGGGPAQFGRAALASLWASVVWGLIGGAIARIAVVQAATGGRVGLVAALRFAWDKKVPLVWAPLSPLVGVAFFAALCAPMGLLYRWAGRGGEAVAGALAFLPLLAGLVMALILLGLAAGWPLMIATVAAEGEDTFDALSRSYSYVFQRPGRYAAYVALAWGLGVPGLLVVGAFARAVVALAAWGLAFGAPDDRPALLFRLASVPIAPPGSTHAAWMALVVLLAFGWVYSYFWTAAAHIYLLLRRDVDGTPWYDIPTPGADAEGLAPVAETMPGTDPPPGAVEVPVPAPGAE